MFGNSTRRMNTSTADLTAAPTPARPDFGDHYEHVAFLGSGGQGRVFKALDRQTGQHVAFKWFPFADEAILRRFNREVEALKKVSSDRVASILDYGATAAGPFIVTAFIEGQTLHDAVNESERWDEARVWEFATQLAQAIADIHSAGVVHHDLKPGNVMLTTDGVVVIDLGAAHMEGDSTYSRVGTPNYVAPENASGRRQTPSSDVWGWAACMRAVFGATRTDADSLELTTLRLLVDDCLKPDPGSRPCQSGSALVTRVRKVSPNQDSAAQPRTALRNALMEAATSRRGRLNELADIAATYSAREKEIERQRVKLTRWLQQLMDDLGKQVSEVCADADVPTQSGMWRICAFNQFGEWAPGKMHHAEGFVGVTQYGKWAAQRVTDYDWTDELILSVSRPQTCVWSVARAQERKHQGVTGRGLPGPWNVILQFKYEHTYPLKETFDRGVGIFSIPVDMESARSSVESWVSHRLSRI